MRDGAISRVLLLDNPAAGGGRSPATADAVQAQLQRAGLNVVRATSAAGPDPGAWAREALGDHLDRTVLVAVGGDGTVNIGLNVIAGTSTPFGVVPSGTGNDIASELGLPLDPAVAAEGIIKACRTGATRAVDAVRWHDDHGTSGWFCGVLGMGFDSIVNERANGWSWPRGRRRYDLAVLREVGSFRAHEFTLTVDGQTRSTAAVLVAIGNLPAYGGGLRICNGAEPDDGLLDLVVVGEVSLLDLVRMYPSLRRGGHIGHPQVEVTRFRTIRVESPGIIAYADGERLVELPLTCEVVPGAITLLDAGL